VLHHRALDDILKALVELLIDGTLAIIDFERHAEPVTAR
jgi:hypothetical protein